MTNQSMLINKNRAADLRQGVFMNSKINLSVILTSLVIAAGVLPITAYAQTATATDAQPPLILNREARRAEIVSTAKTAVKTAATGLRKTNADNEIDRRITALNATITRINAMQRVSADQKTSLVSQAQNAIDSLAALKAKIAADTDAAMLKTDKQSIVNTYRIFALLIPKVEIMSHADSGMTLAAQMVTNDATVQAKIQSLQTAGKDVSSLNTLFADRQSKITDAQTQAQNAINGVVNLTPDGYPDNKTSLTSARDLLKTGRQDLQTAYQDLVKINQTAKTLK